MTTTTASTASASPRTIRGLVAAVVVAILLAGAYLALSGGGSPGWSQTQTRTVVTFFEARHYSPAQSQCITRRIEAAYKSASAYRSADPGGRAVIVLAALGACR